MSATPRGEVGGIGHNNRFQYHWSVSEEKSTIITSKEHGEVSEGPRPTEVVGGALDVQHAGGGAKGRSA